MRTDTPGVDWLLACDPRPAQLEALARSFTGVAYRDSRDGPVNRREIRSGGGPAVGWGHYMEMRVGKTPTLLNEFLLFKRDYGFRKLLVWSPNRYKGTWALEVEKFGLTEPVHVFNSDRKKAAQDFIDKDDGILIVNWEVAAHPDLCAIIAPFVDAETLVGGDEAILIKNKESLFFKNSVLIARQAGAVRPMTGKPVVQGPHDLYSQFRWMRHLSGMEYLQFRNRFCVMGGFKGKSIVGVKNEEQLQELMFRAAFFARRRDWATFFEPEQVSRKIQMLPAQLDAYQSMEEDFVIWLESGAGVSVEQIITKHLKLQQVSSGFFIDEHKQEHDLVPPDKLPKVLDLKALLEDEIEGKTIVVARHGHSIDILTEQLAKYNPAVIRGQMKPGAADAEKFRFNNDPVCRVIIGQDQAIKYGHTLMGTPDDPCQTIYYYENGYSLDTRAQTMERNQGEGQTDPTVLFDPVCSPIEAAIAAALQRKEDVAATILGYYKGERGRDRKAEAADWN